MFLTVALLVTFKTHIYNLVLFTSQFKTLYKLIRSLYYVSQRYSYGKDVIGFMRAKVCALFPGHWSGGWNRPVTNCQAILKRVDFRVFA